MNFFRKTVNGIRCGVVFAEWQIEWKGRRSTSLHVETENGIRIQILGRDRVGQRFCYSYILQTEVLCPR